jgi:hypothetical protein
MSTSHADGRPPGDGGHQDLCDDNGDPIGTREFVVDQGLSAAPGERLTHAMGQLTREEVAELASNREFVDRAKGLLATLYDIDADAALELLRWRCQQTDVTLRAIARQLVEEFPTLTAAQRLPTTEGYDEVLLTVHQRVTALKSI